MDNCNTQYELLSILSVIFVLPLIVLCGRIYYGFDKVSEVLCGLRKTVETYKATGTAEIQKKYESVDGIQQSLEQTVAMRSEVKRLKDDIKSILDLSVLTVENTVSGREVCTAAAYLIDIQYIRGSKLQIGIGASVIGVLAWQPKDHNIACGVLYLQMSLVCALLSWQMMKVLIFTLGWSSTRELRRVIDILGGIKAVDFSEKDLGILEMWTDALLPVDDTG